MQPLALALVGLGAGAFGVMVGAGGGIIMAPVLLLFFDIEPAEVAGTSLGLVALNSFSGAAAYSHMRLVDRRSGLLFALAAVPGSVGAPFVVAAVAPELFRAIFAVLLLALATHMLARRVGAERRGTRTAGPRRSRVGWRRSVRHVGRADRVYEYEFNEGLAIGFNALLGFGTTFLGTGGGFVRTPVLVAGFGFPIRIAVATSVFALAIYATAGAAVHGVLGHIDWYPTFVWAGAGFLFGSQIGARLGSKVPAVWIIRMLAGLLIVMGVSLLAQAAGL